MKSVYFIIFIFIFIAYCDEHVIQNLNGTWKNELNSTLSLTADHSGLLTGYYTTQVGNVDETRFKLVGQFFPIIEGNGQATLAFVVNWNQSLHGTKQSVTAWSAQLIYNDNNELVIDASWILKENTSWNNRWNSATTNIDLFTKVQ